MVPERQRPLVDIAAEVMAESPRIGISYTGFCLTSLPHKRLPDEQTWEKKGLSLGVPMSIPSRHKIGSMAGLRSQRPISHHSMMDPPFAQEGGTVARCVL